LRAAKEQVSDSLLIAMVLKGLPDDYKAFIAITTQSENIVDFLKFKTSLKHFEETEKSRAQLSSDNQSSVMKLESRTKRRETDHMLYLWCSRPQIN